MPRGGARAGAGRKQGSKSKSTLAREELGRIAALSGGRMVLERMMEIATSRNHKAEVVIAAGRTVLPYLVKRLPDAPHEERVDDGKGGTKMVRIYAASGQMALGGLEDVDEVG